MFLTNGNYNLCFQGLNTEGRCGGGGVEWIIQYHSVVRFVVSSVYFVYCTVCFLRNLKCGWEGDGGDVKKELYHFRVIFV